MKSFSALLLLLFSLTAFAETSPQATPSIDGVKSLAAEHKFDDAIALANSSPRKNSEDLATLGCLTWSISKMEYFEATNLKKFPDNRITLTLSSACDNVLGPLIIEDSANWGDYIVKVLKTDDGVKQFKEATQAVKKSAKGILQGGYEVCKAYRETKDLTCQKIFDAKVELEIFSMKHP